MKRRQRFGMAVSMLVKARPMLPNGVLYACEVWSMLVKRGPCLWSVVRGSDQILFTPDLISMKLYFTKAW